MDFQLTGQQREVQDQARSLAREHFRDKAFKWPEQDVFPLENIQVLAAAGLLGLTAPAELGGSDRPYLDAVLAIEAVGSVCPMTAEFLAAATTGPANFLKKFGTRDQQDRFLVPIIRGEKRISVCITETGAGSATTDLATRARVEKDVVVVDGSKIFCSRADASETFLVYVRFGPGVQGIGAIILDRETPGLTVGPTEHFMSGQHFAELSFEDARVPIQNILVRDNAFKALMGNYGIERVGGSAKLIGIAQLALDLAVEYVKDRHQFGKPIAAFQGVQWMLADMYVKSDHARLVTYRAVANIDAGLYSPTESSVAKLVASEAAMFVADRALQLFGAYGFVRGAPIGWLYRLARGFVIAGGTSEIQRNMIGQAVIGQRFSQRST